MCKSDKDDKEIKEINVYRMFELEHSDKNSFLIFALDRKDWRIIVLNLKYRGFYNIFRCY